MDEYRDHVIYRFPKRRRVVVPSWLWVTVAALACVVVGLMFLSAARAQQQADPLQSLSLDWQALATAQGHVATGIQAIAGELTGARKKISDMDAYLKACGDKPGCTVPVEAPQAQK